MSLRSHAVADAKKASYIGKKVVIAVKASGDDPSINRQLAAVMAEANALNVPKDVVNKNIKRAMDTDTANYDELTYEGYGHGGVGLIVNVLSDNKNRAVEMVTTALKKEGCKVAASGSVAFNFARKGRIAINDALDEEALLELAIEGGCDGDVELQEPDVEGRGDSEDVKCVALTEVTEVMRPRPRQPASWRDLIHPRPHHAARASSAPNGSALRHARALSPGARGGWRSRARALIVVCSCDVCALSWGCCRGHSRRRDTRAAASS